LGEEKVHAANGKAHFFLLSLGGGGFKGGYFSGFPGSIMLTIPHHPLTLIGALKGKRGVLGGGARANHELLHQAINTHFFIVVDVSKYFQW